MFLFVELKLKYIIIRSYTGSFDRRLLHDTRHERITKTNKLFSHVEIRVLMDPVQHLYRITTYTTGLTEKIIGHHS